jgi:endonuclease III
MEIVVVPQEITHTKIRISQDKMMEAFGGKTINFMSSQSEDGDDDEEVDSSLLPNEVAPGVRDSSSVSTITATSTITTRRNYPRTARRAQDRDTILVNDEDVEDVATVVTKGSEVTQNSDASKTKRKTTGTGTRKARSSKATTNQSPSKRTRVVRSPKKPTKPARQSEDPTKLVLPDGTIHGWLNFVDSGGYSLTCEEKERVKVFVKEKHRNTAFVSEAVKFHLLVYNMRKSLHVNSARDAWTEVLPPKSAVNFEFCCLFLMVATPNTPDDKIIEVFGPLFANNFVTDEWVLQKGIEGISDVLTVLGRQHMTAKYIVSIAEQWKGVPRNYRSLTNLPGVGAKVALVTVAECFNLFQGVPCDVHMVRIFKALNWMPRTLDEDCLVAMESNKKGKRDDEYELARASIEGWFPMEFWSQLNQTYAGLGQLLRIDESRKAILNYVDKDTRDWTSKWRLTDLRGMRSLVQAYQQS